MANVPAPRSDTVSPSPFVITNADWTFRHYLLALSLSNRRGETTTAAAARRNLSRSLARSRKIVHCSTLPKPAFYIGIRADTLADRRLPWKAAFVAPRKLTTRVKSSFRSF